MWQIKENRDMKMITILTWIITTNYTYVHAHTYKIFAPIPINFLFYVLQCLV